MPLQLVQSVKSAERHKVSEAGVLKKKCGKRTTLHNYSEKFKIKIKY